MGAEGLDGVGAVPQELERFATGRGIDLGQPDLASTATGELRRPQLEWLGWILAADELADHHRQFDGLFINHQEQSLMDQPRDRPVRLGSETGVAGSTQAGSRRQRGQQVTLPFAEGVDLRSDLGERQRVDRGGRKT